MKVVSVWCSASALYLLFAGTVSAHESAVAILLGALATPWAWLIRHRARRNFEAFQAHAGPWLHTLRGLNSATLRTAGVLSRVALAGGSPGRTTRATFLRDREDAPRARSRRASAVLLASMAPDRFVLRERPGRDTVLMHELVAGEALPDPQWLA